MFVAVDVGDAVRREVTRVVTTLTGKLEAAKAPPKVVWVKPASLHVTIRFLGELEWPEVERIQALLDWQAPAPQLSTLSPQLPQCPCCGKPMALIGTLPRSPPGPEEVFERLGLLHLGALR